MGNQSEEFKKKLRELEGHRKQERQLENEISKLTRKVIAESVTEQTNAHKLNLLNEPIGLNNPIIRDYLCFDRDAKDIALENIPILILGSSPWKQDDFFDFLSYKNFQCENTLQKFKFESESEKNILVLGSLDFKPDNIDTFIELTRQLGADLKIYTQELFIYFLITGEDPLETWEEEFLLASVDKHDGIKYVLSISDLTWPEPIDNSESIDYTISEIDLTDWDEESPLRKLGYTVREGALSDKQRQEILTTAYNDTLFKYLKSDSDKKKWGKARSAQRLYAITNLIRWLDSFQGGGKPGASNRWRSDLQWLKKEFYNNRMAFKWPNATTGIPTKTKESTSKPAHEKRRKLVRAKIYKIGNDIFHKKLGWGTVINKDLENNQVGVRFSKFGMKTKKFDKSIAIFYEYE